MIGNDLFTKYKMLGFCLSLSFIIYLFPLCQISLATNSRGVIVFTEEDAKFVGDISDYIKALGFNQGIERSLTAKLDAAVKSIQKRNYGAAAGQLEAFLNQIDALQGRELTFEQVQNLKQAVRILPYPEFESDPLEFPFAEPSDITRLAAFGVPKWSGDEPHNGIDLILQNGLVSSSIISPVKGTIMSITVDENPFSHPPGQPMIHVLIFVNYERSVGLTFEPSTVDPALREAQINAITVQVGQGVDVGQHIGNLLAGELGYPHLHYSLWDNAFKSEAVCPYQFSSASAKAIFDSIPISDGNPICMGP
jgi:murein DD-endopeptidase MepM/ murein hydrolase activator NlpD